MRATSTDALVLVDKPAGVTSFDVVRAVGRAIGTRRVGHSGTLDPFATGLLIVLTGRATRLIRFVPDEPKVYEAVIEFGTETDTDDVTGAVTRSADPPTSVLVYDAIAALTGNVHQLPPNYSAKKIAGKRAYAIARKGEEPALVATPVVVHAWDNLTMEGSRLTARISCGRGTYIRSLARDLGRATDSAAHLAALRRVCAGPFDVRDATPWASVLAGEVLERPIVEAVAHLPRCEVAPDTELRIRNGQRVAATSTDSPIAILDGAQRLVAIARVDQGTWRTEVVIANE